MIPFKPASAARVAAFFCGTLLLTHSARPAAPPDECTAYAGTITTDSTQQCLVNGSVTLVAQPGGDAVIPPGYQIGYILTSTNGLSIEQVGPDPSFTVSGVNIWRIHSIVYDPNTLDFAAILDLDHAYQLQEMLVQGGGDICASLNMSGAGTKTTTCPDVCPAHAGSITTEFGPLCLVDGEATLTAVPGGDVVVPPGFTTLYVLTRTNGLIIEQVSALPSFTVNTVDVWRIHTLVYDPSSLDLSGIVFGETDAYALQEALIQGGGSICASLDMSGAPAKTVECQEACTADAGTISALNPDQCLVDGQAQLEALPDGNAVVPDGYSLLHVLTTGPDLLILATGPEPSFTVDAAGPFAIHTLVYDPATLDLSGIIPGQTSAFEIAALLLQGGGPICGSLDVAGAQFQVADCAPVCNAFAGTLTAVADEVCRVDGIAELDATPNGDAVVPDGYSVAYILARANGIIENVEPVTLFEWPLLGGYVIHTLVYDPFTIDPYDVVLGTTTIEEINSALIQGGGPVCGSLDLSGAPIAVVDCTPACDADAGTLAPVQSEVCRVDGMALLQATPGGDAVVPTGYSVAYILARDNGIIENVEPDSDFEWPLLGGYVIHTLVYDPATLNPFTVVLGVTNISAINEQLIQGGGTICGSLDLDGAAFSVIDCAPPCDANAGADANFSICSVGGPQVVSLSSFLNGDSGGSWTSPDGQPSDGSFEYGVSTPGVYTYVVGATDQCDGDTAYVTVIVVNFPNAGTSSEVSVCDSDAPFSCLALLGGSPDADGTWTGPDGAPFDGTFDPATDAQGVYHYTVAGAPPCLGAESALAITVTTCCDAGADADTTVCFTDEPFTMIDLLGGNPCPGGEWTSPDGAVVSGVFDPGTNASGAYTYSVTNNGSVDVATLTLSVIECPTDCEADAGTLMSEQPEVCLQNGSAILAATTNGDAVIPAGYISAFLLSTGAEHTLVSFENSPFFVVTAPGLYTIHTVVYDFNTWDLSGIEWGTTTAGDVAALFIQGGGNICASLDLAGAQFLVSDCIDPCAGSTPDAGIGGDIIRCTIDPEVWLFDLLQGTPDVGGIWTGPDGSSSSGFFNPLTDQPGVYVYTVFDLPDCDPDTTQLNISVVDCPQGQQQLVAWPNPAVEIVNFQLTGPVTNAANIIVLDALGRRLQPPTSVNGAMVSLRVAALPAGSYSLHVIDGPKHDAGRFVRAGE